MDRPEYPYPIVARARAALGDEPAPPAEDDDLLMTYHGGQRWWARDAVVALTRHEARGDAIWGAIEEMQQAYVVSRDVPTWNAPEIRPGPVLYGGGLTLDIVDLDLPAANQTAVSSPSAATRERFRQLADEWSADTGASSKLQDIILHPAYLQIIGMGREALPLILGELERKPSHWFTALASIAREDPAADAQSFDEAIEAWLEWGRANGVMR